MSDAESIRGATNRARRALGAESADFGVGFEGGIQKIGSKWFDCGWAVVASKKEELGIASTVRIEIPKKLMKHILAGKELGEVNDLFSKNKNSKQKDGYFGFMTNRSITRTHGYKDGLIIALSRFLHSELWK